MRAGSDRPLRGGPRRRREGLRTAHRFGLRDACSFIHGNHGESLFAVGRWDEAEEAWRHARLLAQTPVSRALAAEFLARLALARGDVPRAAADITVMREEYREYGDAVQYSHTAAHCQLAYAVLTGRYLDARDVFARTAAKNLPPGSGRYSWPLAYAAAAAESASRGLPAAGPGRDEALRRIRDFADGLPRWYPPWRGYGVMVDAELRRAAGEDTPGDWQDAAEAFAGVCRPAELARVRLRWAETLLAAGERDDARRLLAQARETAGRLGARPLAGEAERLARRARLVLGDRAAPAARERSGTPAGCLTRREREVLALVAAGRSNREIARELFIAPKTASVHVSNILAKLEVSGRGEAAALAQRLGLAGPEQP